MRDEDGTVLPDQVQAVRAAGKEGREKEEAQPSGPRYEPLQWGAGHVQAQKA